MRLDLALHDAPLQEMSLDPLRGLDRARERDCNHLRCIVCHLLAGQNEFVCGELAELVKVSCPERLQRMILGLAQGLTASGVGRELGIPLSRL